MSSPKRQKSRFPHGDTRSVQGSTLAQCDGVTFTHCRPTSQQNDNRQMPEDYSAYLRAPSSTSSKLELGTHSPKPSHSPKLSRTASPSSTPSPLFSQSSSLTTISSLCSVPEDMEILGRTLTDNGLFFSQNPKAAPPSGKSSICFESSTSPELIGLSTLFPNVRGSAHYQTESDITPSLGTSTTLKSDEADQPLSVKRSPTQPVTDGACIKTQPARFVDLDRDTQRKIFKQVLVRGEYYPYYRCGMLADGPWSPGSVDGIIDAGIVSFENVNLSLLQVNKYFNTTCSNIFYSANHFIFYKADICRWWIRHIGLKNFSRIRSLGLALGSGFLHNEEVRRSSFEQSQEEMWLGVLHWMKNRHNLQHLHIKIDKWQDLTGDSWLTPREKDSLLYYRRMISDLLQRFRGIQMVEITSCRSRWFSSHERDRLSLLMQQQKKPVRAKPKELSLIELIRKIRLEREEEEQKKLRKRRQRQRKWMVTMSDSFAINKVFEAPRVVIPRASPWSLDTASTDTSILFL